MNLETPITTLSLLDLPPEIILYIFHWAAHDPIWKNWDSSWRWWDMDELLRQNYDWDSWPRQSRQTLDTIKAISLVNRSFRDLASEVIFRQVTIAEIEDLRKVLVFLDPEKCRWIKRLTISVFIDSVWRKDHTDRLLTLVERCPNLVAFSNEVVAMGESSPHGVVVLEHLLKSCPGLRRLRWKPFDCLSLSSSQWGHMLSGFNLLEDLEFEYDQGARMERERGLAPTPAFPHLAYLAVRADEHYALPSAISPWDLPNLRKLELKTRGHPSVAGILQFLSVHGKKLKLLTLDERTSTDVSILDILEHCGDQLEELVFHSYTPAFYHPFEQPSGVPPAVASTSIHTVALLVGKIISSKPLPLGDYICHALSMHQGIRKESFPNLKQLVVVLDGLDDISVSDVQVSRRSLFIRITRVLISLRASGVQVVDRLGRDIYIVERYLENDVVLEGPRHNMQLIDG